MVILLVAPRRDQHAVRVAQRLRDGGQRVAWVDAGCFPTSLSGTVHLGPTDLIRLGDLNLREVGCVWLRRCALPRMSPNLPRSEAAYARAQCHAFLWGLAEVSSAVWCNPVPALVAADGGFGKLGALRRARELGLRVPRTCATTDPAAARTFVASCPGGAIYKPFRSVEGCEVYTGLLGPDAPLERLRGAPGLLQELVPKAFEVRVVTIADRSLATAIHSQTRETSKVDFRLSYDVPHEPHALPDPIADRLATLTSYLDLRMGVHDLIVTPDGEYVYLETNQQGQWLWLQERTGQDYVGHLADGLVRLSEAGARLAGDGS